MRNGRIDVIQIRKERNHRVDISIELVAHLLSVSRVRCGHRRLEMRNCHRELSPEGPIVGCKLWRCWSGIQIRLELLMWGQDWGNPGAARGWVNLADLSVPADPGESGDVS